MVQSATGAVGHADPQVLVLFDRVSDERVVVAFALVRFEAQNYNSFRWRIIIIVCAQSLNLRYINIVVIRYGTYCKP